MKQYDLHPFLYKNLHQELNKIDNVKDDSVHWAFDSLADYFMTFMSLVF